MIPAAAVFILAEKSTVSKNDQERSNLPQERHFSLGLTVSGLTCLLDNNKATATGKREDVLGAP